MPLPSPLALPIRLRLAVGYALLLVVIIGAVGVFLLTTLESSLLQDTDETLRRRAVQVEREIAPTGSERLDPEAVRLALASHAPQPREEFASPGLYAQVIDRAGVVVASSPNLPAGQLPVTSALVAGALDGRAEYANLVDGSERVRVLAWPVRDSEKVVGVVLVGESLHYLDVALRRTRYLLALAAAISAGFALVGGWWLTSRALGPVATVTRVARRIAETGQFAERLAPPPARDELGELVATFNDMLARLERTFRRQREFLADASHELRGPLMVIRGNLDLLKLDLPKEDRIEGAREAAEEVERMSRLVADLLFLAEVDAQEVIRHEPVPLHEVVESTLDRARALDGGSHEVVLLRNDPTTVQGDRDRLGQLLWNLVENALRYTPRGGRITLTLRRHGEVAELAVSDTGIGIPAEHLPRIFERFYRVDKSRSRQQGGTGLGLAIARQVAEAHGGQVRVRSEPGQTTFTVALPAREP